MVAAWSVDRLGRSLHELIGFLNESKAKDVDLYVHQQSVDTSTPAGRALFQMLGVFAEFERAMIIERVRTGLKRAKADGKTLGRRKISAEIEAQIREQLALGLAIRKIATLVEVVLRCS
jgi:DNA invertase Pin-like site-specific DNA recombinase